MKNRRKRQNSEKNLDFSRPNSPKPDDKFIEFLKFQQLYEELKTKDEENASDILKKIDEDILLPVTIFRKEIGALETICIYLKDNLGLSNKKIAALIGRSSKSVWQAYNKGAKKLSAPLQVSPTKHYIPSSILKNTKFSVLENIVLYIKQEFSLSLREISEILKRDERTIWTVHNRARRKNES